MCARCVMTTHIAPTFIACLLPSFLRDEFTCDAGMSNNLDSALQCGTVSSKRLKVRQSNCDRPDNVAIFPNVQGKTRRGKASSEVRSHNSVVSRTTSKFVAQL